LIHCIETTFSTFLSVPISGRTTVDVTAPLRNRLPDEHLRFVVVPVGWNSVIMPDYPTLLWISVKISHSLSPGIRDGFRCGDCHNSHNRNPKVGNDHGSGMAHTSSISECGREFEKVSFHVQDRCTIRARDFR
jgi:hypothetical protein